MSSFCQGIVNEQESRAHELLWGQMKSCFWSEKACISLDQKQLTCEEQSHPGTILYLTQERYLAGQQDSNSKWIKFHWIKRGALWSALQGGACKKAAVREEPMREGACFEHLLGPESTEPLCQ